MEPKASNISEITTRSNEHFVEANKSEKRSCLRWRYVTSVMAFLGLLNSFCIRGSISMAIVSMTSPTHPQFTPTRSGAEQSYFTNRSNESDFAVIDTLLPKPTLFDWNSEIQGIILGGFFWGYIISLVISGYLADKYGSKNVMLVGGLLASVGSILGPIAAETHVYLFVATRAICGLGLSVFTPCCHSIIARWFHPSERNRFLSFIYSGNQFGVAASFTLTGYLCKEFPTEGWKWSFYIFGASTAAWLVLWYFLAYSMPKDNPWISDQERLYIESALSNNNRKSKTATIPWKSIAKSMPIWAIVINGFGQGWGFHTFMTQLPTYMKTILGFDLSQSGLYASLPYLVTIVVSYVSSISADYLIKLKILRILTVRRLFSLAGMLPCGICLLVITFFNSNFVVVYALLVVGPAMFGCMHSGSGANHIDLAPNYAGILQGVVVTSASIPGILSPYVTGVVLGTEGGAARWNIVFYISAGMLIGPVIFYIIFADTQILSWNNTNIDKSEELETSAIDNSNFVADKTESDAATLQKTTDLDINLNALT